MEINLALVFRFWSTSGFSCSCQDRFDHLFPQDEQGRHFLQTFRDRFIAARVFDFADQVFAAQFFQVIGRLAGGIGAGRVFLHFGNHVCALEPLRSSGQGDHGLQNRTHSGLVDIHASEAGLSDLGRLVPILQTMIREGSHIHAAQGIQEAVQDFLQPPDNLGELGQRAPAVQLFRVVNDDLDAQDAFAFGIHLGGDLPEVYLEDRQVILRSLDHDFATRFFFVLAATWTFFGSKDRLQGFDLQQTAGSVNGSLKDLFQLTAAPEQEITTVFFLVD